MGSKIRCVFFIVLLIPVLLYGQDPEIAIVPRPAKIQINHGELSLNNAIDVFYLEEFAELSELLEVIPNLKLGDSEQVKKIRRNQQGIRLSRAEDYDQVDANGYLLEIDHKGILLKAHSPQAMISGIYSLMQLCLLTDDQELPYLRIDDKPQFAYRGMHLDVSKHFMPLDFVKKYIDLLALYKFNHFHWHLTGEAGWRIEIDQYPELTQKAAWRTHASWKDWRENGGRYVEQGSPNANGGYYTQEQAKEVVDYARKRGITVIPEISMPGHSEEVLAVYPELSCTGEPYTQGTLCLGNENTYQFLKNVLDEIVTIFPSPYIHIGADEAEPSHWENCSKCQALIQQDSLESEKELQHHLVHEMDEYLQSKGRQLIGWDDILEGELSEGATVMNRGGRKIGIQAANTDRDVIMAPGNYLNFDKYQSDPRYEPEAIGGYLPLEKVYHYEPLSDSVEEEKKKHIIGAQGTITTEYMPNFQHVEYMAFPRALALAEVVWTNPENRSWKDFLSRLQQQYSLLQKLEVNYHRPSFQVISKAEFDSLQVKNTITLSSEQFEPQIRYTVDGSTPEPQSTLYNLPIDLSKTATIKAATFLDSARVSEVEELEVDIHKAIGKEVTYNTIWAGYPAQEVLTLTNGIKGGLSYQDEQWQGFTEDLDIIIDFERREEISSVAMTFMQAPGPGIYFPGEFTVLVSDNGKTYRELGTYENQTTLLEERLKFQKFEIKTDKPAMARYIQIKATNPMGNYLLTDEVIIY
ncbi:MAG: glycoside hydrolase family 20 protein [Sphingobacterium sp.]